MRRTQAVGAVAVLPLLAALALGACSARSDSLTPVSGASSAAGSRSAKPSPSTATATSVYAAAGAGALSAVARAAKPMVYVPNTLSNSVQLIDPTTYQVVGRFKVGREPQHVVPSWDLKTLWVNADLANTLTPIDPRTGHHGAPVPVEDPYNLYFTPDGKHALVMAERLHRIDVRDPHSMALQRSLKVPCDGINHADYTADLTSFMASCEFNGKLVVADRDATVVRKVIDLNSIKTPGATSPHEAMHMIGSPKNGLRPGASAMPQDVRLTPDGRYFLVADMLRNGVWVIDAATFTYSRFIHTGMGAHGIYPSRDGKRIFVANRDEGSVSVLDASTLAPLTRWVIPGGGSPDMGGVTADGSELWLSGRYDNTVYVFDTTTGKVLHKIPVDGGPHGLAVWPQPGRFSLGHTGNMR
jgi:YVTN family beta-propeller protein